MKKYKTSNFYAFLVAMFLCGVVVDATLYFFPPVEYQKNN